LNVASTEVQDKASFQGARIEKVCVDSAFSIVIIIIQKINKQAWGSPSNNNAVTLLCIFNHNYSNPKKVNKRSMLKIRNFQVE